MLPTCLSVTDRTNFVYIAPDKLTLPFPKTGDIHYFEVDIADVGARSSLAVGLASSDFSLNRYPGCEPRSWGYHGDDGRMYADGGRGEAYGPQFQVGDVIGCGLNLDRGELFFTRNGRLLPVAATRVRGSFYAVVGLHSCGETASVNFGAKPFRFDLAELLHAERKLHAQQVAKIGVDGSAARALVRNYLRFGAFAGTLAAFDATARHDDAAPSRAALFATPTTAGLGDTLSARATVCRAVERGAVADEALPLLAEHWPTLLSRPAFAGTLLRLHCQAFVEAVRAGDTEAAIEYARSVLAPYRHGSAAPRNDDNADAMATDAVSPPTDDVATLHEVLGLLAYDDPLQSPLAHLLAHARRRALAAELNRHIVAYTEKLPALCSSDLELALRHLKAALRARRKA